VFSKKHQRGIMKKVLHFSSNLPASLGLRSVQRIRGPSLPHGLTALERDIGAGPRAALVVGDTQRLVTVYIVGTHDYAMNHYLRALDERIDTE
jgi:hypothetical protein